MAKRLRRRVEEERPAAGVEVAEVGAESLPFIEASFDTVVSTLVFCTVDYPQAAVAGAHRVLSRAGRCCSSSTSVARGGEHVIYARGFDPVLVHERGSCADDRRLALSSACCPGLCH